MTHGQISEGTIERYVRRELAQEELRSFEEHLLDCPECFEEVQIMERFVAGVRNAARTGSLAPAATPHRMPWLSLALAAALAVVLIGGSVWVAALRTSLRESMEARTTLAQAVASAEHPVEIRAGNLPIAVLRADRAAESASVLKVPASAGEIALWMDVEPDGRYKTFDVDVLDPAGRSLETVQGLMRNSEGALAVILPATKTPVGRYTVKLASAGRLLAQYNLQIAAQ